MQYTDHYNLNLPEGTDIVNPLVQDNPNYTAIDGALYANKVRTVGNATEVKSGTVHAITRSDSDIDVIRFTSTGDWITGDTMTVDGVPVSVFLPNGAAPLTGAYVINSEVVSVLNGSRLTLLSTNETKLANDITNINGEITTINGSIGSINTALLSKLPGAVTGNATNFEASAVHDGSSAALRINCDNLVSFVIIMASTGLTIQCRNPDDTVFWQKSFT